jgi:hypothetical protein
MSYHEYLAAKRLHDEDTPFYALIMAAMRKADNTNARKLHAMWPETWAELFARYHAPGGLLQGDQEPA